MKPKAIYITNLDMQRLQNLLDNPDLMQQKPYLQELGRKLERAVIVPAAEIPADTLTMNSKAKLFDINAEEEMILTLSYPEMANIDDGKISVLAPIGMAILGLREGETIEWKVPDGKRRLRVERILYQPEAAGEYSL